MELSNSKKIARIVIVTLSVLALLTLVWFILKVSGLWEKLNSVEKLQSAILDLGFWGRFAFVLLQFLQVTFIPIPSPILVVAGSLIYGPFEAGLLSLAGILLGSAVAFFIGRVLGWRIVVYMVGEKVAEKWKNFLSNCKYTYVIMMLLPFFPDDVICLVAGLTDMSWAFFMGTQFVTRPIGIFLLTYFSSGQIIPYHGWGLIVWGIFAVLAMLAVYLSSKYNKQIENFINKLLKKKTNKP